MLTNVYESEELAKTAIRIFNADGQALRLLAQLLYRDLKKTRNKETLFREDSMATKTTRNYLIMISQDYLKSIIPAVIGKVQSSAWAYEIDETKASSAHKFDGPGNRNRFRNLVQDSLTKIFQTADQIPT